MTVNSSNRPGSRVSAVSRISLVLAIGLALTACGSDEPDPAVDTAAAAQDGSAAAPAAATPPVEAVSEKVAGLDAGQLRDSAREAYSDNRLYAPAGDNALEYYLALRDKSPDDPSIAGALTDLLPMTVIATEQSINREDFAEANRLTALLEKAAPAHPALARLQANAEEREQATIARAEREKVTAEEQAVRQVEIERQRLADQKRQQEEAAAALAEQEAADEAEAEAARLAQEQQEAERVAAEQRAAAARAAAAAKPTAADLRPLAMASPQYPRDALRARQSGEVVVEYTVGTNGSVTSARVVRAEPARLFDRAALEAVESWRFQPISAPVTTRRTIGFNPGS